jgi:hypothetical protein
MKKFVAFALVVCLGCFCALGCSNEKKPVVKPTTPANDKDKAAVDKDKAAPTTPAPVTPEPKKP